MSYRYPLLSLISCLGAILIWVGLAAPSQAHWADLAVAEIQVEAIATQMILTFPTGLVSFADDDQSGQLSVAEVQAHTTDLQNFLNEQIQLTDGENRRGALTIQPVEGAVLPPSIQAAPNSHSTLRLTHTWEEPVRGLKIHYGLFLPGVSTASCLATILQNGQLKTFLFTPTQQTFALTPGLPPWFAGGETLLAIAAAVAWGAVHSMSPGHGKTIVGAYLVGERATPKHAMFLALVTTVTHTIGVFALGLVTLFAAQYILPEQLYPWLSLASGALVISIGVNLFCRRLRGRSPSHSHQPHSHQPHSHQPHSHQPHSHDPAESTVPSTTALNDDWDSKAADSSAYAYAYAYAQIQSRPITKAHCKHDHPHHTQSRLAESDQAQGHTPKHEHDYDHGHEHEHEHKHKHKHEHGHLPPGTDGSPITWSSLLALGISGGLVPCPAALVLLLSAIALGKTAFGLVLVTAFSVGLAAVLTGLGLLLVYAKHLFKHVPTHPRFVKALPAFSATCITLIGIGISIQAVLQLSGQ